VPISEWDEFYRRFLEGTRAAISQFAAQYPETQLDVLENRVALILARTLDALVEEQAFNPLRLANPTLLGFGFHDHDQCVVRLLHLPD
jgi:hypothetical protein